MAKIKNINGTSEISAKCKCGTWKDHWLKHNVNRQSWPAYCVVKDCHREPTVGAHVQLADTPDMNWYILPLCHEHNLRKDVTLEYSNTWGLASANQSNTCSKP